MIGITREQVRSSLQGLKRVRSGELFEAPEVRRVLAEAAQIERQLDKWQSQLWAMRLKAQEAFCTGWPKADKAPWHLE